MGVEERGIWTDTTLLVAAFASGGISQTQFAAMVTALQIIDNFISGSRGLVTEDNSAAIKAAVEIIDNMISGSEAQVDVVGALPAGTNAIGKIGHDTTSLGDGRQTVTTLGNAVALASSTACKWVLITAETDNTGVIVVGGSTVVATLATRRGTPLFAGESVLILTDNLADIFLDTTVNTDGVTFSYGV